MFLFYYNKKLDDKDKKYKPLNYHGLQSSAL